MFGLKPHEKFILKTCGEFAEAFAHTTKASPDLIESYTKNIGVLVSSFMAYGMYFNVNTAKVLH